MNNKSNIWYFEDIDLYNILCPHKVPSMNEKHAFHTYKKDDFIYFEDEASEYIYLVADGRVKIGSYTEDGKEITKAIIGPGEVFGEHPGYSGSMEKQSRTTGRQGDGCY